MKNSCSGNSNSMGGSGGRSNGESLGVALGGVITTWRLLCDEDWFGCVLG